MDYSPGDDSAVESVGESFEEPEMIDETSDISEPEFTETSQETVDSNLDTEPVTPAEAPEDFSIHAQPNGIEVLPSPETEALEGPYGMYGGGPEGGY